MVVENNSLGDGFKLPKGLTDYGAAAASWNQYAVDHNLTQEQTQEGLNRIATGEGPSWGTTYKVHPVVQAGGDVSIGTYGRTYAISADDNHVSINGGDAYGIGAHAGATIGLSFGPYFPGIIGTPEHDFSINAGTGVTSWGLSGSKDGIGFSFGVGPSWGVSATKFGDVDVNGNTSEDLYHHDFK
ncbi:hypothetical protein G6T08_004822 [Salmonella enterica]|nr:hypothetical protein [Salmonella enterica]EBV4144145.1 hypothetical protein [Salmonella enterica subsp. enterica serovar Benin]EBE6989599.1 hypothetical protein [Salmonella enterica]EBE7299370.1 hypothetical protein [Salmonella enterica]EBW4219447.1 hypothetical protein [Salmonella enterica subsp. enterica serovar Benin]